MYDYDSEWTFSKTKLKITGNILELVEFEREFAFGKRPKSQKLFNTEPKEKEYIDPSVTRKKTLRKAKNRLVDLINTNVWNYKDERGKVYMPVFLTLTYKKNQIDLKESKKEFSLFIKRFSYFLFNDKISKVHYVAVIEFQKRGAVHFHCIFFNMRYVPVKIIEKRIWGHGMTNTQALDRIDNIGFYLTKYFTKYSEDKRMEGSKAYLYSKGLIKPQVVYDQHLIQMLLKDMPSEAITNQRLEIPVKYLQSMNQYKFNLKDFPHLKLKLFETYNKFF